MSQEFLEAVRRGDIDAVRRMIDEGVDVNFVDYDEGEMGPLEDAAELGHVEIVRLLLHAGARNRVFVEAAIQHEHPEIVSEWLKLPGMTDQLDVGIDSVGFTLLMIAALGSVEVVRLLVEAGANVDERAFGTDESALDIAVRRNNPPVVHYLWPLCSQVTRGRAGLANDPRAAASDEAG